MKRIDRLFGKTIKKFSVLCIFSIAMGFLEAIVVIYLRQLYYPQGFDFPLSSSSEQMLSVELLREVVTIIMLVTIGIIAGKNYLQKFFYFIYTFAIWDISYYIGLKLLINWPPSFLTWDILFLIPLPWIGPVLAPIVVSLTMILFSGCIVFLQERGYRVKIRSYEVLLLVLSMFTIFYTFIWDFSRIIIQEGFLSSFFTLAKNEQFKEIILQYKPTHYNWYLFAIGEILILFILALILMRAKSKH